MVTGGSEGFVRTGVKYEAIDAVSPVLEKIAKTEVRTQAQIVKARKSAFREAEKEIKLEEELARRRLNNQRKLEAQASQSAKLSVIALQAGVPLGIQVVRGLANATQELARAGADSERTEERLFLALNRRTGLTRQAFERQLEYNQALSDKLGIDDDALSAVQAELSARGVANDKLEQATRHVIGLREVTGSLESATDKVAKAYAGKLSALQKLLPTVTDYASAMREMDALFVQAEGQADTLAVQLDRLGVAWDNAREATARSKGVQEATSATTTVVNDTLRVYIDRVNRGWAPTTALAGALVELGGAAFGAGEDLRIANEEIDKRAKNLEEASKRAEEKASKFGAKPIHLTAAQVGGIFEETAEEKAARAKSRSEQQQAAKQAQQLDEQRTASFIKLNAAINENTKLGLFRAELSERIAHADREELRVLDQQIAKYNEVSEALGTNIRLTRQQIEAKHAAASAEIERVAKADEAFELSLEAFDARQEKATDLQKQYRAATQNTLETIQSAAINAGQSFTQLAVSAAQGSLTGKEAFQQLASTVVLGTGQIISAFLEQAAIKKATATANVLATGAEAAAQAGKDAGAVAGPAAVGVIPAVIALVAGIFATLLTSFKHGGEVTGGTPGKDSVPALLMPKERVLTVDENRAFETLMGALGRSSHSGPRFAGGGVVARPAAGSLSLTLVHQQLVPERDTAFRSTIQYSVLPTFNQMIRDGQQIRDPRSFGPNR